MPRDSFKKCIAIIAPQRSGTTVFQRSLSSNHKVTTFGEIFYHSAEEESNFFHFLQANKEAASLKIYPTRDNMILLFEQYFDHLRSLSKNFYIIDIKQNSLHHFDQIWKDPTGMPFLLGLLQKNRVQIIRIKRKNIFQQVLSRHIAQKMRQRHFTSDAVIPTLEPFSIKPEVFYDKMLQIQAENRLIDAFLKDYQNAHFIYYEDMFVDDSFSQELLQIVHNILGRDDNMSYKLALKKINTDYYTFINNREELVTFFQKTPFREDVTSSFFPGTTKPYHRFSALLSKYFHK